MTARAWYGFILRRFPPAFRDRFSGEVLDLIEEQRATLGAPRAAAVGAFHLATTLDLLATLMREREVLVRRASGTLLLVAAVAHTGYDFANPSLSMGIPAWGLTLIALAAGVRFCARPTRHRSAG
ncbi:MAG TPA: hypothetical protein VJ788_06660 [Gemmatimonadota bacterium]|nr:hypothetical protein [Gemmatimonadota bacterium]